MSLIQASPWEYRRIMLVCNFIYPHILTEFDKKTETSWRSTSVNPAALCSRSTLQPSSHRQMEKVIRKDSRQSLIKAPLIRELRWPFGRKTIMDLLGLTAAGYRKGKHFTWRVAALRSLQDEKLWAKMKHVDPLTASRWVVIYAAGWGGMETCTLPDGDSSPLPLEPSLQLLSSES